MRHARPRHPAGHLAREYHVSDRAIAKRAALWGIQTPGRGFWEAVRSGKLPHPNGAPPIGGMATKPGEAPSS